MRLNLSKGLTHIRGQVSSNSLTDECGGEGCQVYRTDIPRVDANATGIFTMTLREGNPLRGSVS